ncbi:hypothetical protein [Stenotrophomonas sp.]|uniref:hypothetical protein n=1 Tax=Stenotrophomonas sp. TaxID=69392 RepID=UPI0028B209AA|nr:hypothetical protein [Stenotrophomonas sp.]
MHLYLQEDQIRLQAGHTTNIRLPLSLASLLADGLQRFPPSEQALEQAIASTEDALMPWIPALRLEPDAVLECADAVLAPLPELLVYPAQPILELDIDEVERAFNQLAQVAAGTPAKNAGLPERADFVAALVVVRELMHHVGWEQLRLREARVG